MTAKYIEFLLPWPRPTVEQQRSLEQTRRAFEEELHSRFRLESENDETMEFRLNTCVELLNNAGLVEIDLDVVTLSGLGRAFLECCEPPKANKAG